MSLGDTLAAAEAPYRERVFNSTWGHLAPKKNKTYKGFILFADSTYDGPVLIESEFNGLDDSPWLYEALNEFIREHADKRDGSIYWFDGAFRNYKFNGKVKTIKI